MPNINVEEEQEIARRFERSERLNMRCAISNQPLTDPVVIAGQICERSIAVDMRERLQRQRIEQGIATENDNTFIADDNFTIKLIQFLMEHNGSDEFHLPAADSDDDNLSETIQQLYALFDDVILYDSDLSQTLYVDCSDGSTRNATSISQALQHDLLVNGQGMPTSEDNMFAHPYANQLRLAILEARQSRQPLNFANVFKPQKRFNIPYTQDQPKELSAEQKKQIRSLSMLTSMFSLLLTLPALTMLIGPQAALYVGLLVAFPLIWSNNYSFMRKLYQRMDNHNMLQIASNMRLKKLRASIVMLGMALLTMALGSPGIGWLGLGITILYSAGIHLPWLKIHGYVLNLTSRAWHNTRSVFEQLFAADSQFHNHTSKSAWRIKLEAWATIVTSSLIFTGLTLLSLSFPLVLAALPMLQLSLSFSSVIYIAAVSAYYVLKVLPQTIMLGMVASQKMSRLITGSQSPFSQFEQAPSQTIAQRTVGILGRLGAIGMLVINAGLFVIRRFDPVNALLSFSFFIGEFFSQDLAKIEVNASQLTLTPASESVATYRGMLEQFADTRDGKVVIDSDVLDDADMIRANGQHDDFADSDDEGSSLLPPPPPYEDVERNSGRYSMQYDSNFAANGDENNEESTRVYNF